MADKTDTPTDQENAYAQREVKLPKLDFSDTELGRELAEKQEQAKSYTIKSGDTLWGIAEEKLGDGNRWREVYELNKGEIGPNPDLIHPGKTLKLPV